MTQIGLTPEILDSMTFTSNRWIRAWFAKLSITPKDSFSTITVDNLENAIPEDSDDRRNELEGNLSPRHFGSLSDRVIVTQHFQFSAFHFQLNGAQRIEAISLLKRSGSKIQAESLTVAVTIVNDTDTPIKVY